MSALAQSEQIQMFKASCFPWLLGFCPHHTPDGVVQKPPRSCLPHVWALGYHALPHRTPQGSWRAQIHPAQPCEADPSHPLLTSASPVGEHRLCICLLAPEDALRNVFPLLHTHSLCNSGDCGPTPPCMATQPNEGYQCPRRLRLGLGEPTGFTIATRHNTSSSIPAPTPAPPSWSYKSHPSLRLPSDAAVEAPAHPRASPLPGGALS